MVTSLIASIAIGLAVDDTIHYRVCYNWEFKKDQEDKRVCRYRTNLALCLMKVNFEQDEAASGNPAKEGTISLLGESFAREIPSWDTLGRFGRKTFALLMPQSSIDDARHLCNRLERISEGSHSESGGQKVSLAFGLTGLAIDREENAADLVDRATALFTKDS